VPRLSTPLKHDRRPAKGHCPKRRSKLRVSRRGITCATKVHVQCAPIAAIAAMCTPPERCASLDRLDRGSSVIAGTGQSRRVLRSKGVGSPFPFEAQREAFRVVGIDVGEKDVVVTNGCCFWLCARAEPRAMPGHRLETIGCGVLVFHIGAAPI
jgi:hypothetical protein